MERLIAFALIGLLHVQIQEPASRSTTTKIFLCHLSLDFIIAKYLKQEFDDDLSICVDKLSPCGLCNWRYEDLSMSRDRKVMTLLAIMEKSPMDFYQEVVFTAQI